MQILRLGNSTPSTPNQKTSLYNKRALTIGKFDGIHKGHQFLLQHLINTAQQNQLIPSILSFEPYPSEFFAQHHQRHDLNLNPTRISTWRDKCSYLSLLGIRQLLLMTFNQRLAQLSAHDFVVQVLVQRLNIEYLLVGQDFRFGAKRQGDFALLQELGEKYNFKVQSIDHLMHDSQQSISSSLLRHHLALGQIEQANLLLGRPYALSTKAKILPYQQIFYI